MTVLSFVVGKGGFDMGSFWLGYARGEKLVGRGGERERRESYLFGVCGNRQRAVFPGHVCDVRDAV